MTPEIWQSAIITLGTMVSMRDVLRALDGGEQR